MAANDARLPHANWNLRWKLIALALFIAIWVAPTPQGLTPVAQRMAAVTGLMLVLWLTQAIPLAATSLIPLVAFPLLGIESADQVSNAYMNKNIILFMAGFIIALGIERWGLHRRIALHVVYSVGTGLRRVVLGFMLATAFLSMWLSNTASTLLMLPIGLALVHSLEEILKGTSREESIQEPLEHFTTVLLLGIAYSASIGGLTTLVGTPTNITFMQIWSAQFPTAPEFSAGQWMALFFPLGVVFLLVAWGVLTWNLKVPPELRVLKRDYFRERLKELGRMSRAERWMTAVFAATALLWLFRTPMNVGNHQLFAGWGQYAERFLLWLGTDATLASHAIHDSTVAMGMALLMFLLPGERDETGRSLALMDWSTAKRLPWDILLLIGGGYALAAAVGQTGLSVWLGNWFAATCGDLPMWLLLLAVCLLLTFLTEFTTNAATISAVLPILSGATIGLGVDPRLLLLPATLSTSCAFMLPIATPPNAIIFGSGRVRILQMARYGIILNFIGVLLITLTMIFVVVPQLGIDPAVLPDWAAAPTDGIAP